MSSRIRVLPTFLEYGDYSLSDGGGSASLGPWMERWNFIEDNDDWLSLFTAWKDENTGSKFDILKKYINDEPTDLFDTHDWLSSLRNPKYDCFNYMGQRKFLWWESQDVACPHVILLSGHQASETEKIARSINYVVFYDAIITVIY